MTHSQAKYLATKIVKEQSKQDLKPIFNLGDIVEDTLFRYPETNMIVFDAPRNNGKTSSAMDKAFAETKIGKRFIWIRNQQQQAEAAMTNFLERFADEGIHGSVSSGIVKNIHNEIVGHFISLNGARKTRSGAIFNDTRLGIKTDLVIYDEFNELDQDTTDLLKKLVMLIESIQRDNPDMLFICIGNRDTPTNKLTHMLGLKPNTNFKKSYTEVINNRGGQCVVYRVGINDYQIFRPSKSVSAFLSALDPDTERFIYDGGYLDKALENVLNYNNWIKPTFSPLVGLVVDGCSYVLGEFKHYDKGDMWALVKNYRGEIEQVAFDDWSDVLTPQAGRVSEKAIVQFGQLIFEGYKSRQLYFDEFETLEEISTIFS